MNTDATRSTATGERPDLRELAGTATAVVIPALVIRGLHVWMISDAAFSPLKMGDAASYHSWAERLAEGDWLGDRVFYQAPLYPYFLGVIYSIFGESDVAVRVAQATFGSLGCGFVALAGGRLFSKRAGLVAGGLLALYGPAIFYDGLVQKASLGFFFMCLLTWLLAEAVLRGGEEDRSAEREAGGGDSAGPTRGENGGWRPGPAALWAAAGLVTGLLVLTRENSFLVLPPILLWIGLRRSLPGLRRLALAGFFLAGVGGVLVPVASRNLAVGGEFHLTTSQFGPNFYMGNNPMTDGLIQPLRPARDNPAFERRDATDLAERAEGRELSPGEVSDYWTGRALEYIRTQPLDWLELMGRKVFLASNATEVADTEDIYTHADSSLPLRITGFLLHFGILAPLALLGAWVTWPRRRELWLFYLVPAFYLASVVLFFVFGRYRHPVTPYLAIFAGAGLTGFLPYVRRRSRLAVGGALAATAAAVVFCNFPSLSVAELRSSTQANIAGALIEDSQSHATALAYAENAARLDPNSAKAHFTIAAVHMDLGNVGDALPHYARAVELAPSVPHYRSDYGAALGREGRFEESAEQLRRAVELDPWAFEPYVNLAATLLQIGEVDEAFERLETASRIGNVEPTLDQFTEISWTMATHPNERVRNPELAGRIAEGLAGLGRATDHRVLRTRSAVRAAEGSFGEAIRLAERALEAAERAGRPQSIRIIQRQLEEYRAGRLFFLYVPGGENAGERPAGDEGELRA